MHILQIKVFPSVNCTLPALNEFECDIWVATPCFTNVSINEAETAAFSQLSEVQCKLKHVTCMIRDYTLSRHQQYARY